MLHYLIVYLGCLLVSAVVCGLLLRFVARKSVRIEKGDEDYYRELCHALKALPRTTIVESCDAQQLRKQFDEKSQVLRETRKQLFALEGEFFTLQREWEEKGRQPDEAFACLRSDIHTLLEENAHLKKENSLLEQIISNSKEMQRPLEEPSLFVLPSLKKQLIK